MKRKMTEAEYMDATPEFDAKVAKISASESHSTASDMIIPQLEAPEADDSEHEDPENIVEISSRNSSSYLSSDSSDLSEGTTNFIRQIDEKLQKSTKSVPNETDSVNPLTIRPVTQPSFRILERCLKGELRFATNSLPIILSNPLSMNPFK